jgi:radical SAM enzyme (TIGR01210 family)
MNSGEWSATDDWIVAQRPAKNAVDPWRPYAFLVEPERTRAGTVENVATIFLTNRECPFRCLMCDLWKNTTDSRVPAGAIPEQIAYALERLGGSASTGLGPVAPRLGASDQSSPHRDKPDGGGGHLPQPVARHIKLYNAGNFFDSQAIPPDEWPQIAALLSDLQTVIVESHPLLISERTLAWQRLLQPTLEVAMGLETVHPDVLPRLNKRMTLADFERAARFLCDHDVGVRAFILLRPPFLSEAEGVHWAKRSLDYAFDVGVECCVVIPTRSGNGAMERLQEQGDFQPPCLESLEEVLDYGIDLHRGRVFADLWDLEGFYDCPRCGKARKQRLHEMNLTQRILPAITCSCRGSP